MSNKLSVVIISYNEEKFIRDALLSASFANEIIVLDSLSSDSTLEIASECGAIVSTNAWEGYANQKNKAISLATNNWVFVLDADERISNELALEIKETLKNPKFDGYFVPRKNNFFGKFIKYGGLYPDYSIRLFKKSHGKFKNTPVHESVSIEGKISKLKHDIVHLAYQSVEEFSNKQKKYALLSDKKNSLTRAVLSSLWSFLKIYFFRLGFLEGWRGIIIAYFYAKYSFKKYFK